MPGNQRSVNFRVGIINIATSLRVRPIATLAEITVTSLARLMGFQNADTYIEITPRGVLKGMPFHCRYQDSHGMEITDDIRMGRLHVMFSRRRRAVIGEA